MEICESYAAAGEPIESWCFHWSPIAAEILPAQVVSEQDDDVRFLRIGEIRQRKAQTQECKKLQYYSSDNSVKYCCSDALSPIRALNKSALTAASDAEIILPISM